MDSTAAVARQYTIWAQEHGLDPELVLRAAHGVRTVEVIRQAAPHLDAEAETSRIEQREADDRSVRAMAGALELLNSIPVNRWGVVTSGRRALATSRIHRLGIPMPQVLVTAEDVSQGKPAPDPYLKGAELLRVQPQNCVVVEDAVAGIRSAHAAGMRVISLPSTYAIEDLHEADVVVPELKRVRVSLDGNGPQGELVVSFG